MHFRNLSKLYFSTVKYRVLYFYFFFLKVFAIRPYHIMVAEDEGEFNYDEKSEKGPS